MLSDTVGNPPTGGPKLTERLYNNKGSPNPNLRVTLIVVT